MDCCCHSREVILLTEATMRICPLIHETASHSVAQSLSLVLDVSFAFLQTQGYSLDETQGSGGVRP